MKTIELTKETQASLSQKVCDFLALNLDSKELFPISALSPALSMPKQVVADTLYALEAQGKLVIEAKIEDPSASFVRLRSNSSVN